MVGARDDVARRGVVRFHPWRPSVPGARANDRVVRRRCDVRSVPFRPVVRALRQQSSGVPADGETSQTAAATVFCARRIQSHQRFPRRRRNRVDNESADGSYRRRWRRLRRRRLDQRGLRTPGSRRRRADAPGGRRQIRPPLRRSLRPRRVSKLPRRVHRMVRFHHPRQRGEIHHGVRVLDLCQSLSQSARHARVVPPTPSGDAYPRHRRAMIPFIA